MDETPKLISFYKNDTASVTDIQMMKDPTANCNSTAHLVHTHSPSTPNSPYRTEENSIPQELNSGNEVCN